MWLCRTFTCVSTEQVPYVCDPEDPDAGLTPVAAWEFRYAGDRQRYLVRQRDATLGDPYLEPLTGAAGEWYEYIGDQIYRDFDIADAELTPTARYTHAGRPGGRAAGGYLADGALVAINGGPGYTLSDRRFFHADLIGSTRLLTNAAGAVSQALAYTAFSEPLVSSVSPTPAKWPRYGYAGAWGYQSDATDAAGNPLIGDSTFAFSFAHVGARYYAPALGRFTMRDPIGIMGGSDVYGYLSSQPMGGSDPTGLFEAGTTLTGQSFLAGIRMQLLAVGGSAYGIAVQGMNGVIKGITSTAETIVIITDDFIVSWPTDGFVNGLIRASGCVINWGAKVGL